MNEETIGGNWEQIKGKIKATWGKFTDDDVAVMKGKSQEVIGKLQAKYGYSKEEAEKQWKNFADKEGCGCSTTNQNKTCCS